MSTPAPATNAASPADELAALIAKVETMAQLAVHLQGILLAPSGFENGD
jgi:hypothetical protein